MTIVYDANVWLDLFLKRKDFECALNLTLLIAERQYTLLCNPLLCHIVYHYVAKLVEATTARDSIKETLTRAKMLGLHADVVSQAVSAPYPDFEDEMLIAFCLSQKADLLITNDKQLLKRSVEGLRILTSGKALEAIA